MDERTSGLILRTRPLTETSLIVHWLTRDCGRVATVAKGALRPKSPFRGKLDVFYRADLTFARSRRSDLHTLREVALTNTCPMLRRSMARLQQAAYCARLVERTTETDTPLGEVFLLMNAFVDHLLQAPVLPESILAFELKLLRELGLKPDPKETRLSKDAKSLMENLSDGDWPENSHADAKNPTATELARYLHGFIAYNLGRIPAGRDSALTAAD